jgi:hypothetical protein
VAGQAEEDVVEAGPLEPDVVELDGGLFQAGRDAGQRGHPLGRGGDAARVVVDVDLTDVGPHQLSRGVDLGAAADGDDEAGLAGLVLQLQRGALGDDPAVVDDDDAVGQLVGLVEVLGGEEQGRPVAHEVAQHTPELDPAARVEAGRRLVEEEHRRGGDEAGGEVEPAPHAARVVLDDLVAGLGQREPLEQLFGRALHERALQPVQVADEAQVLAPGEQFVDRGRLGRQAHPVPHGIRVLGDVEAGDVCRAAGGNRQRGHHAHGRRLARAIRAEHGENRARRHGEAHAVDGGEVTKGLDEVNGLDRGGAHR